MIRTTLAALLLALPTFAQAEDSQLVSYDLRRILPRWDAGDWSQSLLLPPLSHPHADSAAIPADRYGELLSFELLDLLNQILGDELRREGREMLVEGDALTVLAPAALQQQVRALLDGLEQALAGTVTLRVEFFTLAEGAAEPASLLLADDEAQKLALSLAASGSPGRAFTLQLSAGRTDVLDARRSIPFLFDYNVEIAQGIGVFVPAMGETSSGVRLALRAGAVPGGTALTVLGIASELRALRSLELDIAGIVTQSDKQPYRIGGPDLLQSPEVDLASFAFDTFLPDGKALALSFESALAGKKLRQLVLLRRTASTLSSFVARPIPGTNRTVVALDAGLFRGARLETALEIGVQDEYGGQALLAPAATATLTSETAGFLLEWLKARFSIWRPFGPWILVVTDPAWDRDALAQLERLVKGLKPRTGLSEATFELRTGGARPVRARLPVLEGSRAGLAVGLGRTAITGYSAEVAQNAAMHDPFVGAIFDGLVCSLLAQADSAELRGLAQLTNSGGMVKAGGQDSFGAFERIEAQQLRFDERWKLAEGRTLRLGGVTEKGETGGLVLEVTLAPLGR